MPCARNIFGWWPRVFAVVIGSGTAHAGGSLGSTDETTIAAEQCFVVWNPRTSVEHLVVGARLVRRSNRPLGSMDGYVLSVPFGRGITPAPPVPSLVTGLITGFSRLAPDTPPLGLAALPFPPGLVRVLPTGAEVERFALSLEGLEPGVVHVLKRWLEGREKEGAALLTWPTTLVGSDEKAMEAPYVHMRIPAPFPFVPFADPPRDSNRDGIAPMGSVDVTLWLELGVEASGRWAQTMDDVVAAQRPATTRCYEKAFSPIVPGSKPVGDVQVTLRLDAGGAVTVEGQRMGNDALMPLATCLADGLKKTRWPPHPEGRVVPLEVHALLKRVTASTRKGWAHLLLPRDAVPRLGRPDGTNLPENVRVVASFEPSPEDLRDAFDLNTRRGLELDQDLRWRVVVLELDGTTHPPDADIAMRLLADLRPPAKGEEPAPVLTRGDRSFARATRRPPWWRRRKVQWAMAATLVLLLVAAVSWAEEKRLP